MKFNYGVAILLTLFLYTGAKSQTEDEVFKNWLIKSMEEYPAWLQSCNLDPAPLWDVDLETDRDSVNVTGKVINQVIQGHSNISNFVISQPSLSKRYFTVLYLTQELFIEGNYSVHGDFQGGTPISGEGKFISTVSHSHTYMQVFDFQVNSTGFIDLSSADVLHFTTAKVNSTEFEGLNADGHEKEVLDVIGEMYGAQAKFNLPMWEHIKMYFELFRNTLISEM